jgi:hypothetical protein
LHGFGFRVNSNGSILYYHTGIGSAISSSGAVAINTDYCIAATYSVAASLVTIYLNGVSIASGSFAVDNPSGYNGALGEEGDFSGAFNLSGSLYSAAVFDRAISANGIALLASRPGIAYEMAPRHWTAAQIAAYRARYYSQVVGSGVI